MAALRGAQILAYLNDMSRILRSVRLALDSLATLVQSFLRRCKKALMVEINNLDSSALLPIAKMIGELILESTIQSIWLIGSRANATVHETSDWDILIFSVLEPVVVDARWELIDVLHVGPSGKMLLEGKSEYCTCDFSDFEWELKSKCEATYKGRKSVDHPAGVAHDSDVPCDYKIPQKAILLWSVENNKVAP